MWLTPFYPSPLADGGYDVSDYCAVDPLLGTMTDFDHLVKDAAAHRIRIIVDLVPNHCSSAHPLFPRRAGRAARQPGAGPVYLPRRARPGRGTAAEQLDLAVRQPGLDLLASGPVTGGSLPPDTAAWL